MKETEHSRIAEQVVNLAFAMTDVNHPARVELRKAILEAFSSRPPESDTPETYAAAMRGVDTLQSLLNDCRSVLMTARIRSAFPGLEHIELDVRTDIEGDDEGGFHHVELPERITLRRVIPGTQESRSVTIGMDRYDQAEVDTVKLAHFMGKPLPEDKSAEEALRQELMQLLSSGEVWQLIYIHDETGLIQKRHIDR